MKIILTNDDGIEAPGLLALYEALAADYRLVVVAPENPCSGFGHQVTTHTAIAVRRIDSNRFGVKGTPADCSRLALKVLAPGADWLIAGINAGANLGSDVYNSGTVAAAREAAILGCPAIAISQYVARGHALDWKVTGRQAGTILDMLLKRPPRKATFWNVNLPHPLQMELKPGYKFCRLDTGPHRYVFRREGETFRYEGTIHERPRQPGRDVDVCFGGEVSITLLRV